MKVIFEPLPREPFFRVMIRKVLKKPRPGEIIPISFNGRTAYVVRGVPLNAPAWVVAVGAGVGCYILLDKDTGKNLAETEAMR